MNFDFRLKTVSIIREELFKIYLFLLYMKNKKFNEKKFNPSLDNACNQRNNVKEDLTFVLLVAAIQLNLA